MEYLKQLLRRKWYWFLLYALGYSALTTVAIYRFSLTPILPICVALLPLLIIPFFYFGAMLYIGIRKKTFPGKVVKKRFYQTNYKK